jgi:predicted peroxiredoxin
VSEPRSAQPPGPPTQPRLVVKVTCGAEAPERANQGLTVAATAASAGADVSLWLTGEASWFAAAGSGIDLALEHAAPATDLLAAVETLGRVTVCSQCAARRGLTTRDLRPGARIAGAASFVEEVLVPGTQALVY